MEDGDGRLDLVAPRAAKLQGAVQERLPLPDGLPVPAPPVLLLEGDEIPSRGGAAGGPGVVQEHEGQEPEDLGFPGEMAPDDPRQPDGVGAEILPHQGFTLGGRVSLVEDEVEDLQHRIQPLGEQVRRRNAVGDPRAPDLRLGAHEPLRHGGLGDQERPGDLPGPEASHHLEGEGDAHVGGQRRMAAGEDQPEGILVFRPPLRGPVAGPELLRRLQPPQPLQLPPEIRVAAEPIHGAAAGRGDEPGRGPWRHAFPPPPLQRQHHGLAQDVFRQLEVSAEPDQRGQDGRMLLPEYGLEVLRVTDLPSGRFHPEPFPSQAPTGMIGRTSTGPRPADGILPAQRMASSRFSHSMR